MQYPVTREPALNFHPDCTLSPKSGQHTSCQLSHTCSSSLRRFHRAEKVVLASKLPAPVACLKPSFPAQAFCKSLPRAISGTYLRKSRGTLKADRFNVADKYAGARHSCCPLAANLRRSSDHDTTLFQITFLIGTARPCSALTFACEGVMLIILKSALSQ